MYEFKLQEEAKAKAQQEKICREYDEAILGFITAANISTANAKPTIMEKLSELESAQNKMNSANAKLDAAFNVLNTHTAEQTRIRETTMKNQTLLKNSQAQLHQVLIQTQSKCEQLQQHANQKITQAEAQLTALKLNNNQGAEKLNNSYMQLADENRKLEQQLQAKQQENDELQVLFLELMANLNKLMS
mmetsp:Transcript_18689/g.26173  ORF Transcript_18689/g.26173 Transcript_18689/m.26173 type:complete len:189 (-) Transcript_18689:36-602(-)